MNAYLLPTIESGPKVIDRLIRLIPRRRWDERTDPDRFTPREVAAHFVDWEPIMRDRIRLAAENTGAVLRVYDEELMARDHRYSEKDPLEQCALFAGERAVTAEFLRALRAGQWTGTAQHPERGIQSAEDLANLLLGHDLYHIEQLSAYLDQTVV